MDEPEAGKLTVPEYEETFSVVEFFSDETYNYLQPRFVPAKEAIDMFLRRVTSAQNFSFLPEPIVRVIIVDGGDSINMEWIAGKGITFPPNVQGKGASSGL